MWRLQEIICVVRQSQILHSQHLEAKWRRGCRHCSDHVVHRGWCVAVLTHIFKVNQLQENPSADCAQFSRTVCESRRVVTQVLPQPALKFLLQTLISTTFLLHHALKKAMFKVLLFPAISLTQFGSLHSLGSCFYASFYLKCPTDKLSLQTQWDESHTGGVRYTSQEEWT